jgi:hypothetical protein
MKFAKTKKKLMEVNSRQSIIIRGPHIVPDSVYTTLKYVYKANLNTTSQAWQDQIFRGNSIYDPDYTGAGGQPLGRDQWVTFYQNYRVHQSRIRVNFGAVSGGATQQDVAIIPNTSTSDFTSATRAMESPYSKWGTLTGIASLGTKTITNAMSTAKMYGVKQEAVEIDDQFRAAAGGNPTNSWYWHVFVYDRGSNEADAYVTVEIDYLVEFYKRVDLAAS